ncbi:fimbrillin family protein [Prevotella copri]|uniref:Fimbrillin family protein n=1 Tax=Segatella copri TaxID=165179 RepID=A0AAW5IQI4_9BACT|nr:fimbrillin family protein [Segatella copri]MCP9535842.1 fimbrillin family protein [Segatella copri]MCP9538764.1 fimbrillin family protein [Segatella copri]MCP9541705.1 fimbrillin family protein [Segatella copri]MCP9560003.1 fimbrillin family protein [Segatella copri]MCP9562861.1 fimbrillin family protein [Segatella copri]
MSNKNKLIGLSLIALATLCACNDDNHADGKGNRLVTFSVNAKANGGWSDINGSRSAWMSPQAQQMGEPVEMEGKLNGNSVYLTSEVTEGFPTDTPTFTRGTQITNADGMSSFGVTAFMGSQKYMDHEKITKFADSWKPQTDYFWLNGKPLDFYAWYPYNSAEGTNGIPAGMTLNQENFSSISYTVPTDVSKQEDLMFAVNKNASEPADGKATSLDFKHSLAAVKFVVGDLPTGTKVTSVALKGVKYKGDLAVTAGNNGAAQLAWSNLANETGDFTQATTKKVKENDTDHAITNENQTFFMIPQTLPDDAIVEVVVEDEKGAKVTLTGALQDATAAEQAKNKWEAGNTYTYSISLSGIISAEITFFKGINGALGYSYTSHNISANGDPFTVDFSCPETVNSIKLRFAYKNADGSFEEIGQTKNASYYELSVKNTSQSFRSPVLNNYGNPNNAKKDPTEFVVQMQVKGSTLMRMPSDPYRQGEVIKYHPGTDDNTWYTIWKGTMFPPNYIYDRDVYGNYNSSIYVLMSRKDIGSYNQYVARQLAAEYNEVDENHPYLGKGRWGLPYCFWDANMLQHALGLLTLMESRYSPGYNPIYGEPTQRADWYWTSGDGGSGEFWVIQGQAAGRTGFSTDGMFVQKNRYTSWLQMRAFSATNIYGVRAVMTIRYYQ